MKLGSCAASAMLQLCISTAHGQPSPCGISHPSTALFDCSGYAACSLVLLTFTMTSMRLLRVVAIASNFAFITYALIGGLLPILVLHSLLLPINAYRLFQIEQARRRTLFLPQYVQVRGE